MYVNIDYREFEDTLKINYGKLHYKIIYPYSKYPIKTDSQMKLNDVLLSSALSQRSLVRSLAEKHSTGKTTIKHKKDMNIEYIHEIKCVFNHRVFLSFTHESYVSSSGKLTEYEMYAKTYKVSSAEPIKLEKVFKYSDISPLLWEQLSDKMSYDSFIAKYDSKNYYLSSEGIYLYFPGKHSPKKYEAELIPYYKIKSALAYQLW